MIFNFRNFEYDDFEYKNELTDSGYKIYNKGFYNEYILVEARLS